MWQLCFVEWDSEYWARPAQLFKLGLGIPMASSPLATMEVGGRHNSSFVFKPIKGVLVGLRILLGVTALWRRNSSPGANCLWKSAGQRGRRGRPELVGLVPSPDNLAGFPSLPPSPQPKYLWLPQRTEKMAGLQEEILSWWGSFCSGPLLLPFLFTRVEKHKAHDGGRR